MSNQPTSSHPTPNQEIPNPPALTPTRSIAMLVGQLVGTEAVIPLSLPILRLVGGDYEAAAVLAQAFYWSSSKSDGWFYKTNAQWQEELLLTPHKVRKAAKKCARWLTVEKRGLPAKNHWRVDAQRLVTDLLALSHPAAETAHAEAEECDDQSSKDLTTGDANCRQLDVRKRERLYTETTDIDYLQREKKKDMSSDEDDCRARTPQKATSDRQKDAAGPPSFSQEPMPSSGGHTTGQGSREVPRGAAATRAEEEGRMLEVMQVWNEESGPLKKVRYPDRLPRDKTRKGALKAFVKAYADLNWEDALTELRYAVRSVAAEPWWVDSGQYGLDNLLGKVERKAEDWRANPLGIDADPAAVLTLRRKAEARERGGSGGGRPADNLRYDPDGPLGRWRTE